VTTARARLVHLTVIVVLAAGLYLPGLGTEILRHPLEAKYALAAREMLHGGPRLVAHLFGEIYPDKPPLYFWTTAALGWAGGGRITEVTARLPAAVGATAALIATYALGCALFTARAGLLAAGVLATAPLFFWYGRQGHPDQFLTASVAVAVLGLWRSLASPGGRAGPWLGLAYAAMALGVLSKGLLGLVLPLLALTTYLVVVGPVAAVPRRLGLWPGLPVFLAVVLAWYIPAVARHGTDYLRETVVNQHVVRYAAAWVHNKGAWYYYVGEFAAGFFPWSLFVPGAVVLAWKGRREPAGEPEGAAAGQPLLLPIAWFVTGCLFFSLSTSKRGAYLLPLYPAAALLVGWLWDRAAGPAGRTRWIGIPLALATGAATLLAGALLVVPRRFLPATMNMVDTLLPVSPGHLAAGTALLLGGSLAVWLAWRAGRVAGALATLVLVQGALVLTVTAVRAPQYEARFPVRTLAAAVAREVPPGEPILSLLGDYGFLVAFYLDRPLRPVRDEAALLARGAPPGPRHALVEERHGAVLRTPGARVVVSGRLGPRRIVLLRLPLP
jgi:4-amino-4-deoxy-L-arabinose transferase-like glycosyltransferase